MTDREAIEECYRIVAPLRDGRRERQIKRFLEWYIGKERCAEIRRAEGAAQ